jgi:hypothetical protein
MGLPDSCFVIASILISIEQRDAESHMSPLAIEENATSKITSHLSPLGERSRSQPRVRGIETPTLLT